MQINIVELANNNCCMQINGALYIQLRNSPLVGLDQKVNSMGTVASLWTELGLHLHLIALVLLVRLA